MTSAKLYVGNAVDVLRSLPEASVRCCVSSPPYWGLRAYGTEPQVFGGEPGHAHEWGEELRRHKGGPHGEKGALRGGSRAVVAAQAAVKDIPSGAFCRCGAWRGELGLEPTPELYIEHMVEVFREVRRVLAKDGTLWLNMGDCYATGAGKVGEHPGGGEQGARWKGDVSRLRDKKRGYRGDRLANTNSGDIKRPKTGRGVHTPENSGKASPRIAAMGPMTQPNRMPIHGLKPKDLVMMPARLALALQADGWYLRSQIIWAKSNPMPESVRDRPTTAHESVFLLTKSSRYHYDADALAEPAGYAEEARWDPGTDGLSGADRKTGRSTRRFRNPRPDGWANEGVHEAVDHSRRLRPSGNKQRDLPTVEDGRGIPNDHRGRGIPWEGITRNVRSVWLIPSQPYKGAHFATFPEELARRCIVAGTSAKGHCPECGKPWVRVTETTYRNDTTTDGRPAQGNNTKEGAKEAGSRTFASGERTRRIDRTTGWKPTCEHEHDPIPDVVLDPFGGSGTVAQVATGNGRGSIYIDLNSAYLELARQRIGPMLCEVAP